MVVCLKIVCGEREGLILLFWGFHFPVCLRPFQFLAHSLLTMGSLETLLHFALVKHLLFFTIMKTRIMF